jgi:hypothetical protein
MHLRQFKTFTDSITLTLSRHLQTNSFKTIQDNSRYIKTYVFKTIQNNLRYFKQATYLMQIATPPRCVRCATSAGHLLQQRHMHATEHMPSSTGYRSSQRLMELPSGKNAWANLQ